MTHVVILAAGKGTRMKSADPKVLHQAGGLSLIEHVLRTADTLQPATTVVVVGHRAERVRAALGKRPGLRFALQQPQLGTGHALLQAEPHLAGKSGTVVLLSGDVPLLRPATLCAMVEAHTARRAAATVLTARVAGPHEYGRIVREDGRIAAIVEHKDATPEQRAIDEINSGIYAFAMEPLFDALAIDRRPANAQGEYYLPDLVGIYRSQGRDGRGGSAGGLAGDPRRQQPEGARRRDGDSEDDPERGTDGGRRVDRRSRQRVDRAGRRRRPRHGDPSERVSRRAHAHRIGM